MCYNVSYNDNEDISDIELNTKNVKEIIGEIRKRREENI